MLLHSRPKKITAAVVIVAAIVVIYVLFFFHRVSFSLDTSTVKEGENLVLTTHYYNLWEDIPNNKVIIDDSSGRDWSITENDVKKSGQKAGFVSNQIYGYCPDLPPLNGKFPTVSNSMPPRWSTSSEIFHILPETPPGTYTIHILSNRFCEIKNAGTALKFTVIQ